MCRLHERTEAALLSRAEAAEARCAELAAALNGLIAIWPGSMTAQELVAITKARTALASGAKPAPIPAEKQAHPAKEEK